MLHLDQNYTGFSQGNEVMLEDLTKALQAGSGTDSATFTGGRSLIPESLDRTLVNVLHSQDEAKLFKKLKKLPVGSTVHEYTKRDEVGNEDGAWVSEGGTSFEKDQSLQRRTVTMKYLQTMRQVTLQMATADAIEDAEAIETEAGALWVVRAIERALWDGDGDVVPDEPDGMRKLVEPSNVLDARGISADSSSFEDLMIRGPRQIRDNYGRGDMLYAPTMVYEDIQKLLRDRVRVPVGGGENGQGAYVFKHYPTIFGNIELEDNLFLAPTFNHRESSLVAMRPGTPVISVAKTAGTSRFSATDEGNYRYAVAGVNKYGIGPLSNIATLTGNNAIDANDIVTVTITTAATNATGYNLYRSKPGSNDVQLVRRIPGNPLPSTIVDLNDDLPGTFDAFIMTTSPTYNAIEWTQFLPMMKFQLYPTNAAVYPFLMLLFGALNLKKEEQMIRIKNLSYSGEPYYPAS